MRSFSTDRPTKSNVPYTIDAGHFQYETDLVNLTHQVSGATRTDFLFVPNPTFKVGVTNNADVEVNVPLVGERTYPAAGGPSTSLWGIGDTYLRSKVNLWGNDGGDTAAAIIPYVKDPSAPIGIGDGAVEGGLIGPVVLSLPNSFTLLFSERGKERGGTHCSHQRVTGSRLRQSNSICGRRERRTFFDRYEHRRTVCGDPCRL